MSLLYLFHRLHRHALSFDLDPPTIFLSYYILHSSRAFSIDIILSRFKFSTKEVYSYLLAQLTRDESKKAMKHGEVKKIEASLLNKLTLGFQDLIMNFRKEESIFHGYFENN